MAWVRVHDGALSHPKIVGIFDPKNPFCLWMWGLSYCQQHLTDGLLPREAITFKTGKAVETLVQRGLWERHELGFKVHDYLDWNDSKELVSRKRSEAKERMQNVRQRSSRERSLENFSGEVLRGSGKGISSEIKDGAGNTQQSDAERIMEAFRAHWKRLYGFDCSLIIKPLEFMQLEQQITGHSEAQLQRALAAYFATDDPYVRKARHTLPLFLRDPLKYLAKDASPAPAVPRGCDHHPACADEATHTKRVMAERRRVS